jgi:hypothetical protein
MQSYTAVNSGRNLDLEGFFLLGSANTFAGFAGIFSDIAFALTFGTGGNMGKGTKGCALVLLNLSAASAHLAGDDVCARLQARTCTGLASFQVLEVDFAFNPKDRVAEIDLQIQAQIRAPLST